MLARVYTVWGHTTGTTRDPCLETFHSSMVPHLEPLFNQGLASGDHDRLTSGTLVQPGTQVWRPFVLTWTHVWDLGSTRDPRVETLSCYRDPRLGPWFNKGPTCGDPLGPWFNQGPTCGDPLFVHGPTSGTLVQQGTHVWRPFLLTGTHVWDLGSTRDPRLEPLFNKGHKLFLYVTK